MKKAVAEKRSFSEAKSYKNANHKINNEIVIKLWQEKTQIIDTCPIFRLTSLPLNATFYKIQSFRFATLDDSEKCGQKTTGICYKSRKMIKNGIMNAIYNQCIIGKSWDKYCSVIQYRAVNMEHLVVQSFSVIAAHTLV